MNDHNVIKLNNKMTQNDLLYSLENAIFLGHVILLEDIEEEIDPIFDDVSIFNLVISLLNIYRGIEKIYQILRKIIRT